RGGAGGLVAARVLDLHHRLRRPDLATAAAARLLHEGDLGRRADSDVEGIAGGAGGARRGREGVVAADLVDGAAGEDGDARAVGVDRVLVAAQDRPGRAGAAGDAQGDRAAGGVAAAVGQGDLRLRAERAAAGAVARLVAGERGAGRRAVAADAEARAVDADRARGGVQLVVAAAGQVDLAAGEAGV